MCNLRIGACSSTSSEPARASINSTKIARSGVGKSYLTLGYGTKPSGAICSCRANFDEEEQAPGRDIVRLTVKIGSQSRRGGRGLDEELRRGFCGFPALPHLALAAVAEFGPSAADFLFVRFPFVGDRKVGSRLIASSTFEGKIDN
jgi:hypothetical protein